MEPIDSRQLAVRVIETPQITDERGWFIEAFNTKRLDEIGIRCGWVQDNLTMSRKGVVRGLHYQHGRPQSKLVRCLRGAVFDVVVDIRSGSPTFGRWFGLELSEWNLTALFVPSGFAHGFLTLSDTAEVLYKVSDYWAKEHERGIRWDDPGIGIAWPDVGVPPQLNARDAGFPTLAEAKAEDLFTWNPGNPGGI